MRKKILLTISLIFFVNSCLAQRIVPKENLKIGDKGAEVTKLQEQLKYIGYLKSEQTGIFDNNTKEAIKTFQKRVLHQGRFNLDELTGELNYDLRAELQEWLKKTEFQEAIDDETKESISFLKKDMNYMNARNRLLYAGWRPYNYGITSPWKTLDACMKRRGYDPKSCGKEPDEYCQRALDTCATLPEFRDYSGIGRGDVWFIWQNQKGTLLTVLGYGNFGDPIRRLDSFFVGSWWFMDGIDDTFSDRAYLD